MRETPGQLLLAKFERQCELVRLGILTGGEFISGLFDTFAHTDRVYPEIVPQLSVTVPDSIRSEFVEAICVASRPEFVHTPFYIGGPLEKDSFESEQESELHSSRIRAWAREFLTFFAGLGDLYLRQQRIAKRSQELHAIMQSPYGMERLMQFWRELFGVADDVLPPVGVVPESEILGKEFPGGDSTTLFSS